MLVQLRTVVNWDILYIGGGDARLIDFEMPAGCSSRVERCRAYGRSAALGCQAWIRILRWRVAESVVCTTVHLVRHGTHGLLPHVLAGRMEGVGLTEAGRVEAGRVGRYFRGRSISGIVSSPVLRARETAGVVGGECGVAVEVDAGFEEIDFGGDRDGGWKIGA